MRSLPTFVSATTSLPTGVVNMFTESGNAGAAILVQSADVDMVSYTGSAAVGRQIAAAAAKTLKRVNLELGGKTPMLVFNDAVLTRTVPLLAAGITTFAGQFGWRVRASSSNVASPIECASNSGNGC